jgi:polyribonucleotide nucleotidyltransferase
LIDRPIRPLFPKNFSSPVHIVSLVISHDQQHEPDILAVLGASCALMLSEIPFVGPISPIRIGRVNNEFVINPTMSEAMESDLNLTAVCSESSIVMVEGGGQEVPEEVIIKALRFALEQAQVLNRMQRDLAAKAGKPKHVVEETPIAFISPDGTALDIAEQLEKFRGRIKECIQSEDKLAVYSNLKNLKAEASTLFDLTDPLAYSAFSNRFAALEKDIARTLILSEHHRNDFRQFDEIRPISIEIDVLPCVHGSAVFTRGQTQALVTLTLGTSQDEQKIDDLEGETYKRFMLHYNFPPFAVGEVGFLRGPGRREVGHGALAEKALLPTIPVEEKFPYTVRVVSEILESNGSSSMATVCGASLCLMDGGVPIKEPIAGIAMGLVLEGEEYAILSDISGLEDHLGDMDFKVAGSRNGITAIQMDIKLTGFKFEILEQAMEQAKKGRLFILDKMTAAIAQPRSDLKPFAPRIHIMKINPEKIAAVIGPGGKVIRGLTAETGTKIELEDDGTVKISSTNADSLAEAVRRIGLLTEEVTVGKDYMGVVRRIEPYGAFLEILPGTEGLLHISRFANYRVREVRDEMNEGDQVLVRVAEIDRTGKVKLTRKELMDEGLIKGLKEPEKAEARSGDRDFRGPREHRDSRDHRDSRGYRDSRDNREHREPRDRDRSGNPNDRNTRRRFQD